MNYIKHLASFFERIVTDDRLNTTHISMYVSLFQFWNANRFQNPISISRNELMKVSKISAKATYHKCMKELNEWQYLKYKPSYNPFKGSLVYLFNLQPSNEQALVAHRTKIETSIEQAQEPYINISKHNKQNLVNNDKLAQKSEVQNLNMQKNKTSIGPLPLERMPERQVRQKEKLRQKKKNVIPTKEESPQFIIPKSNQVLEYFASKKFPPLEAEKFYNYFQSNGWLIGGRTKMKNWKAAANNWMLNAQKFNSSPHTGTRESKAIKPKHLQTNQSKNYNEPL